MLKNNTSHQKILIIASDLKTLVRFRLHLIKNLLTQGHRVLIMMPRHLCAHAEAYQLSSLGSQIIGINIENTRLRPWQDLKLCFELYKQIRVLKPDIILSYTIKPVMYGSLMAYFAKTPRIYAMVTGIGSALMGDTLKRKLFQKFIKLLYRVSLPHCHNIFFQNEDDAQLFLTNRLVKQAQIVRINGSGVDLTYYSPASLPQEISFIFVGRLIREKGIFEYIAASKILKQRYPEIRFKILGGFHHNPTQLTREQFFQLAKEANIDFLGEVDDVRPHLESAAVFVLPSYREGLPRSSLEALALGRPIITTDAPGCRETVEEGINGFLVPIKNVDILVDKMAFFIQNPQQRAIMGESSRKLAEKKFDVHQVNQIIIETLLGKT